MNFELRILTADSSWLKASVATRNFPLSADELRKNLGLKDGNDFYIFGTTMKGEEKVLVLGTRIGNRESGIGNRESGIGNRERRDAINRVRTKYLIAKKSVVCYLPKALVQKQMVNSQ